MSTFEWFLLIVVVILVPLVVAVMVTLWTLEQARMRNRRNREHPTGDAPVKRQATRHDPGISYTDGEDVREPDSNAPGAPNGSQESQSEQAGDT